MMPNHILIVEDEERVARVLKTRLEENGFRCTIAANGLEAVNLSASTSFSLALLDINLPYINGFDVCRKIRETNEDMPIIMLTALAGASSKITGFNVGADDYILKPFEFDELIARIRVFLKRSQPAKKDENIKTFDDLTVNLDRKTVTRGGQEINLTSKEFQLLELFIGHPGMLLSRAEIAEKVWNITFDTGTNVIDVYVNYLRKKIDKGFDKQFIQTRVGFGYFFNPEG